MRRFNLVVLMATLVVIVAIVFSVWDVSRHQFYEPINVKTRSPKFTERNEFVTSRQADGLDAETKPKSDVSEPIPSSPETADDDLTPGNTREVTVVILGLKRQSAEVYVAVFESAVGFPNPRLSTTTRIVPSTEDQVQLTLNLRDNHPTAIAVFQDLDGNGVLSKHAFGYPVEPYGFSNNPQVLMGPPKFHQSAINVQATTETIEIQVRSR